MRSNRRSLVLLGALVVTIALTWWIRSGGDASPVAATAPAPRNAPAAEPQAAGGSAQTPIDVRIEALSAERQPPAGTGRNPFQFRAKAAPPPPPTNTALSGPVMAPVPAGPPPAPPITLKFIGLVERASGMRVAVLSDGHSPVYGVQGQVLLGRYRIVSIGVESIELEHQDGRGRQTIRLTGQ